MSSRRTARRPPAACRRRPGGTARSATGTAAAGSGAVAAGRCSAQHRRTLPNTGPASSVRRSACTAADGPRAEPRRRHPDRPGDRIACQPSDASAPPRPAGVPVTGSDRTTTAALARAGRTRLHGGSASRWPGWSAWPHWPPAARPRTPPLPGRPRPPPSLPAAHEFGTPAAASRHRPRSRGHHDRQVRLHRPPSVSPGAMVTVMNKDGEAHTVTADSDGAFDDKATAGASTQFHGTDEAGQLPVPLHLPLEHARRAGRQVTGPRRLDVHAGSSTSRCAS